MALQKPQWTQAAQNLVRLGEVGIGKLRQGEIGLHRSRRSRYMRPRLRMRRGSKLVLDARRKRGERRRLRLEHRHRRAQRVAARGSAWHGPIAQCARGSPPRRHRPRPSPRARRARRPNRRNMSQSSARATRGGKRRPVGRRDRHAPDRAFALRRQRRHVAHFAPRPHAKRRRPECRRCRTIASSCAQRRRRAPRPTGRPFEPQQGVARRPDDTAAGRCAAPLTSCELASAGAHGAARRARRRARRARACASLRDAAAP